jgi:hypothetical protein
MGRTTPSMFIGARVAVSVPECVCALANNAAQLLESANRASPYRPIRMVRLPPPRASLSSVLAPAPYAVQSLTVRTRIPAEFRSPTGRAIQRPELNSRARLQPASRTARGVPSPAAAEECRRSRGGHGSSNAGDGAGSKWVVDAQTRWDPRKAAPRCVPIGGDRCRTLAASRPPDGCPSGPRPPVSR